VIRAPFIGAKVKSFDASGARGAKHVLKITRGVAVLADTYWQAKKAAENVKVEWDLSKVLKVDTEKLRGDYARMAKSGGAIAAKNPIWKTSGQLGREFDKKATEGAAKSQSGGKTLDQLYELPYLPHATMEPMNCTADVRPDGCEIWAPTQGPAAAREIASQITKLKHDQIKVTTTFLGGGFGRRIYQDYVAEAVEASQAVGAPVKIIWSREDDFQNDFYRPMMTHYVRAAFDENGISHWLHNIAGQSILSYGANVFINSLLPNLTPTAAVEFFGVVAGGLFRAWNPDLPWPLNKVAAIDMSSVEGVAGPIGNGILENIPGKRYVPYKIDNFITEYAHKETGVPVGFWRSIGHSHSAFVVETVVDEMAASVKVDPYKFRLSLLEKNDSKKHAAVLRLAAEKAGWGTALPNGVFRGIAQHQSFHSYCAQVVEISMNGPAVKVRRVVVAIDCGFVLNPDIAVAQAESAVIFGLSAALKQAITFKDGAVQQSNFHDSDILRMFEAPVIEVHFVQYDSSVTPTGMGEICVPPTAPALCNAIFAATGKRLRRLPVNLT
ncbi:MAG: molybdopterin cofactor-binding domain-containing protein, partial [Bdellovibrionia bacterium]